MSSQSREGYSRAEAIYALNHVNVDWNERAVRAKEYLKIAAIASIGSDEGLAIYERLIEDPQAIGGSFYWYERERLRRQIATKRVLERLPSDCGDLAAFLGELGWPADRA